MEINEILGGHFDFFRWNRWSGVVVPLIFGISITILKNEQIVMPSSQSARLGPKLSHIRPTREDGRRQ